MGAADNFFQKAEQALKKRNYDYAIELWQQGLAVDPDRIEERKKLRATAIRRCQDTGASTTGGALAKLKNAGLFGSMKKYSAQKKWEELIVETEKYLAKIPQDGKVLMALAGAFEKTSRLTSALQSYREAADIDPKNTDALKAMGRIYQETGDVDEAIHCWERVKSVDPSDQDAGKSIRDLSAAKLMKATEDRRKGGDDSFRSLLKDEDESAKLQKKQQHIRNADDAVSAIEIKREEVEKDPENPRMWRELGDLQAKSRDYKGAKESYKKSISLNPNDMYAKERLGKLQETQYEHAVDELTNALRKDPDNADLKQKLEQVVAQQAKFMLGELANRVKAHPTDFGLKARYGERLFKAGDFDAAIAQYQAARKDPKFVVTSLYHLGMCFSAKGLYGPAISQYNEALSKVESKESELGKSISYDLAMSYKGQGELSELEKAMEHLEGIMVIDIGFRDVSAQMDEVRKLIDEAKKTDAAG